MPNLGPAEGNSPRQTSCSEWEVLNFHKMSCLELTLEVFLACFIILSLSPKVFVRDITKTLSWW